MALADKIDTLTGFWAIDEKPTGSKDPFALRRAALGVIRLVLGNEIRMKVPSFLEYLAMGYNAHVYPNHWRRMGKPLGEWSDQDREDAAAVKALYDPAKVHDVLHDLLAFFHDRLKVHLRDEGIRHDVIDACLAMPGNDDLVLLVKRADALSAFLKTDDGENLIQGFKRANNILTQAEEKDGVEYSFGADPKFAEDETERTLFAALDKAEAAIQPAMKAEDFGAAMSAMASLRAPIDAFFEAVQVNTDNEIVRRNRLNLLSRIRTICLSVADLTKLEG